ncbi:hypothetical protein GCM10025768_22940 [Microbacterium pseudoresistens]
MRSLYNGEVTNATVWSRKVRDGRGADCPISRKVSESHERCRSVSRKCRNLTKPVGSDGVSTGFVRRRTYSARELIPGRVIFVRARDIGQYRSSGERLTAE